MEHSTLADVLSKSLATADAIAEAEAKLQALLKQHASLLQAQRVLEHEKLVELVHHPLGLHHGRPMIAMLIARCLMRWRILDSGDAGSQALLHSLLAAISKQIDEDQVSAGLAALQSPASPRSSGEAGAPAAPLPLSSGAEDLMGHYSFWLCAIATLLSLLSAQFPAAFHQGLSSKDQASVKGHQRGSYKPSSIAARLLADIRGGISAATGERAGSTAAATGPLASIGEQGAVLPTAAAAKLADIQQKLTSTWANFSKALGKGRGMAPTQSGSSSGPTVTAAPATSASGELPPPGDVQPGTAKSTGAASADISHHSAHAGEEQSHGAEADALMRVVSSGSSVVGDMVLVDSASLPAEGDNGSTVNEPHGDPIGRASSADGTLGRASSAGTGAATPHSATQQFVHVLGQQLQQCYAQVRDALKKQLSQLLPQCIQAPTSAPGALSEPLRPRKAAKPVTPTAAVAAAAAGTAPLHEVSSEHSQFSQVAGAVRREAGDGHFTLESDGESGASGSVPASPGAANNKASAPEPAQVPPGGDQGEAEEAQQGDYDATEKVVAELAPWAEVVACLQAGLQQLREKGVPRILIKCILKQVLNFVNCQLFNQLLLRPECCCATNACYVLRGLRVLDQWVLAGAEETEPLYLELRHVRQAANLLAAPKAGLTLDDIAQLCSALTPQQIYRLCTTYWVDSKAQVGYKAAAAAAGGGGGGGVHKDEDEQEVLDMALINGPGYGAEGTAPDMVSGEVLEALKSQEGMSNGGMLVTFLLEEAMPPIIAPHGTIVPEVLKLCATPDMFLGLPLPKQLDAPDCPRQVFEFIEDPVPVPEHLFSA